VNTSTPIPPLPSDIPTATPFDEPFSTPEPPNSQCTSIADNDPSCNFLPQPDFPMPEIYSPTPIPFLSTLTPLPSITRYVTMTGVPGTPIAVGMFSTNVDASIDRLEALSTLQVIGPDGTPMAMLQSVYETGATVGSAFGFLRGVANVDMGRWSNVLLFLIALIGLNLLIRLTLFAIPILISMLRMFMQIIQAIASAFDAIIPL
jgi:hypothetical protein